MNPDEDKQPLPQTPQPTPYNPSSIYPTPVATQPVVSEANPHIAAVDEHQLRNDATEERIAKQWRKESLIINLLSIGMILVGLLGILASVFGSSDQDRIPGAIINGLPAIFGLLLLARSNIARILVMLGLAVSGLLSIYSGNFLYVFIAGAILLTLNSSAIKKHF